MNHSGLVDLVQITNIEDLGSGLPPSTSEDAGKVLKVDSDGVPGWGEDAMATVDQNYDSESTHAQSGLAVAQAISGINEVPAVESTDDSKVLKATYSGGVGTYSWETAPASQVNSDWDAVSGVAQILNKPTLATVATSGDYTDLQNKPTIPAAQVQSDYAQSDNSAVDFIKNKPDLSVYAQSANLATVATTGDYTDLLNKPTIPTVPTTDQTYNSASTNPQSGTAVAGALATVNQVPASTSADENKVLTVNAQGTTEWANTQLPSEKSLTSTNSTISITEGASTVSIDVANPLPSSLGTAGQVLSVNSGATGVEWANPPSVTLSSLNTAGVTDIQQVASLPASPVATVLYLIPET